MHLYLAIHLQIHVDPIGVDRVLRRVLLCVRRPATVQGRRGVRARARAALWQPTTAHVCGRVQTVLPRATFSCGESVLSGRS